MGEKQKYDNIITLPEITVTPNKDGTTTVTTNKDQLDKWKRHNNFMIPIDRTKQRLSEMRRKVSQRDGIGRQIAMHTPGIFNPLAWTTSMIGGYAINEASKALGYDSYGNMAYKNSPVLQFIGKHTNPIAVQTVAEFFNPGYFIGAGLHVPTDKSMRIFHNNISKNSKSKLISKEFEKIKNNNPEINTENNPAHTLYVDKNGKQKPIQTQSQTQGNPLNDIIDLARQGNVEAIQQLKQYGIEPGNPGVYRFISQEEADNILKGGRYAGRFNDGRVDVTANPNGTTAANSSFRITFKPKFDLYKPSQRLRMKNAQLQDGWIMDGYGLDDVAIIERRLPNGNYEPYKGPITITPQNAASMTPEQWTIAQYDAVARGDMTEAQRLRDLHFKIKTPDNKIITKLYHGTNSNPWYMFDINKFGSATDGGVYGKGLYLTKYPNMTKFYGKNRMNFYVYSKTPLRTNFDPNIEIKPSIEYKASYYFNRPEETPLKNKENVFKILKNKDAVSIGDETEVVIANGRNLKSADAVTYDDKGIRIPLGERDNFNINDIRYGLIPFVGLTGLTLNNK